MVRRSSARIRFWAWLVWLGVTIGCNTIASPEPSSPRTASIPLTELSPSFEASSPTSSSLPLPLPSQAVASCPVTLPNGKKPSVESNQSAGFNTGNAESTLFIIPWPEGKIIFRPGGPGEIAANGSLAMKWPWYRQTIKGQLIIEGQRLDAPAPPLDAIVGSCYGKNTATPSCGYGDTGFTASTLIFPTEGCWEVTGKVGSHRLTFVTLAVKVTQ
jgi:hypothetical protein